MRPQNRTVSLVGPLLLPVKSVLSLITGIAWALTMAQTSRSTDCANWTLYFAPFDEGLSISSSETWRRSTLTCQAEAAAAICAATERSVVRQREVSGPPT